MPGSSKKVVAVVDDDYRILESLGNLLESAGHTVQLFASAKELLEKIELSEIDCLISDIGMPAMDGLALQRLLRISRPGLPVILITGRHEMIGPNNDISQSGRLLFEKPFNDQELLAAITAEMKEMKESHFRKQ
jgi:FixJ family two-component response regulator